MMNSRELQGVLRSTMQEGLFVNENNIIETTFLEDDVAEVLKKGQVEAEGLLQDEDKMERFLQRLEKKLKEIPKVGNILSNVPVLVSMVRSYIKKEYTDIPVGTIVAIISALLYFLSGLDLIPDAIPVVGFADDAAVITFCLKMVGDDVQEYIKWREATGRMLDL